MTANSFNLIFFFIPGIDISFLSPVCSDARAMETGESPMETNRDATATSLCASSDPLINFPDVFRPV
jgi:hypothetical protein